MHHTVDALLGNNYDPSQFRAAYGCLDQTKYHPFTTEIQDNLAYSCLILSAGFIDLDTLLVELKKAPGKTFQQFLLEMDDRSGELSGQLCDIHNEVTGYGHEGDPTPFKTFRQNEYLTTVERMDCLDYRALASKMLQDEIVITQEVREIALTWREEGALLFNFSDKLGEDSIPTDDLIAKGYRAIQLVDTPAIGG